MSWFLDWASTVDDWRIGVLTVALLVLAGVIVCGFVWRALAADRQKDRRLVMAVNNMSQGLVMFDAHERMVVCNQRYIDMYNLSPEIMKPGVTLRQIIEHRISTSSLDRDVDEYHRTLSDAMARGETISWVVEAQDGRSISVINKPMSGGDWLGTHEDITEQRRIQKAILESERRFRILVQGVKEYAIYMLDPQGRIANWNAGAERVKGYSKAEIIGRHFSLFYTPEDRAADMPERALAKALEEGKFETEGWRVRKDGSRFWAHVVIDPIRDNDGQLIGFAKITRDRTEQRQAQQELESTKTFLDKVIDNVPVMITVKDVRDLRYKLVNRAGENYFGVGRDQVLGKTVGDVFPEQDAGVITLRDRETLQIGHDTFYDVRPIATPGRGTRMVTSRRVLLPGEDGKPQYLLTVTEDVTERKYAEARVEFLAYHDPLTGLPNRVAFNECLDTTLTRARTSGESFAVLCIDLDRFKEVNDVLGHPTGDRMIGKIGERIQAAAGGAFVARIGGDEFAIIVADGELPASAEAVSGRLLASAKEEIEIDAQSMRVGFSVGIAIFPSDATDMAGLMANADAALYRAKEDGRGSIRFFEPEMDKRVRERRSLQHDLDSAVARGEIKLHYQPQARIGGEVTGFEALVRWRHPIRGDVPPATFIPIAEESGLIMSIGECVLREACREAASWPRPLRIAVNLSPIQFTHGDLVVLVHEVLLESGLKPDRLELEITEGVLIGDFSRAVSVLRRLKALGVRIAMDDFGTGYSSLSYLQAFPFDKIKIDRSFIANLNQNPQSAAIVRAVIGLGHGLDVPITAEGVETRAQMEFLARDGCDEAQGFLIGRPSVISDYAGVIGREVSALPMRTAVGGAA